VPFGSHDDGGVGGVGDGVAGSPFERHTRFAGLPPEHDPEQQSASPTHDCPTWAKLHCSGRSVGDLVVGAFVGMRVGEEVGLAVVGLLVGPLVTVGASVSFTYRPKHGS